MVNHPPALFIGRFQPMHLGHLDALAQVFAKEDFIIIGIGSTEDDYTPDNPFTAGERYQMIEASILGKRLGGKTITRENFVILPARNIHHYSLWVKHIESILPPFGKVYTGSSIVARLFKDATPTLRRGGSNSVASSRLGLKEDKNHPLLPIKKTKNISATDIRKRMALGKPWTHLVPKETASLIKKWGGQDRVKEIQHG